MNAQWYAAPLGLEGCGKPIVLPAREVGRAVNGFYVCVEAAVVPSEISRNIPALFDPIDNV
jgi:hypothetical protein